MKRLRNISIYYIIFGVLCAISFIYFQLWRILIPGVALLIIFLILRFIFRIKTLPPKLNKTQSLYVSVFLYALPILFIFWVSWYGERPFRQTIIIPENYEGVIAIQYGQYDGQRQWTGGFLGIGASRLIKVDTFGIAFTQFKYHNNNLDFLNTRAPRLNNGLEIYFKNDLKSDIPYKEYPKSINFKNDFEKAVEKGKSVAYFTEFNTPPLMIFVVTKPSNYHKYFMTEKEMIEEYRKKHNEEPRPYTFEDARKLRKEYHKYY
ncbi:MAG: hypothetical protein L3J23_06420 [Flavobacteriaceae bacterium]|nr:hypothetical protein [Flavobacteriaceae bacterium]